MISSKALENIFWLGLMFGGCGGFILGTLSAYFQVALKQSRRVVKQDE